MPIADLPLCRTQEQVEEALAKPIAYALAPDLYWRSRILSAFARSGWRALLGLWRTSRQRQRDRQFAGNFCQSRGIELLWSHGDRRTGFELLLFAWAERVYFVPLGSNDARDWWSNITDPRVGETSYRANQSAIERAFAIAAAREPTEYVAIGHSLGGALAQYLAHDWATVARCVTFQTAAIPPDWVDRIAADSSDRTLYRHYLHRGDLVYPLSRRRSRGGLAAGDVVAVGERKRGVHRALERRKAHLAMLTIDAEASHSTQHLNTETV